MEVVIDLPKEVKKGKDISVTIKSNLLKIGLKNGIAFEEKEVATTATTQKNEPATPTLLTQLKNGLIPFKSIDPDESSWSLDSGQLVITLSKRDSNNKDWPQLHQ